jgi:hypothetical protein
MERYENYMFVNRIIDGKNIWDLIVDKIVMLTTCIS